MDEEQKKEIRRKIQSDLAELKGQIENLIEITQPISPDNAIGRLTRMDAINNKAVNDSALIKARHRQKALEEILSILKEKHFGVCIKCKKDIPFVRLMYIPETRVCVQCSSR